MAKDSEVVERFYIGYFKDEHSLVQATQEARRRGYQVLDAFSPYPVHGLSEAMGLGPSRLTLIGLWAGVLGLVLGLTLQYWTSAYDWPLIVGGQPFNSWPVFIPVSFELTVLFAGVLGVIALFIRTRLLPGHRKPLLRRVTNDRFALAIMTKDASLDPKEILQHLKEFGAVEVVEGDELEDSLIGADLEPTAAERQKDRGRTLLLASLLLPVVVLGGLIFTQRDLSQPNWILPTQMAQSPAYKAQSWNPVLPNHMTLQPPVEGTLSRDAHPFPYGKTEAERKRAGVELKNPFTPNPENLQRGQKIYETFCVVCHGTSGKGDGPMIPKFPNPPSFLSKGSLALKDGEMFHTITLGRKKMASYASQVSWEDRWRVILYLRQLQKEGLNSGKRPRPKSSYSKIEEKVKR